MPFEALNSIKMKVHISMSSTNTTFFALILSFLCHFAKALQHVNLAMCDETANSVPYCILHDSMSDEHYLHENATLSLLIKLPVPVLTELWLDQRKIEIVTPSGVVINNGQEVIRSEDRDRWTIEFNFQCMNSDFGKIHLVLHIKDVEYRDEQFLHVELKSMDTIFQTTEKVWIPIEEKSNERDNDYEGQARTTDNPAEDPSAILHARIETLQNEKEALQLNLTTTQNIMNQYQMKYFRCLESKDDLINCTMKPDVQYGREEKGLAISTLIILLFGGGVMAYVVVILRGSKLKPTKYNRTKNGGSILQHSAVTFEHVQDFEELFCTVQSTTPEDVPIPCTGGFQYSQPENETTTSL